MFTMHQLELSMIAQYLFGVSKAIFLMAIMICLLPLQPAAQASERGTITGYVLDSSCLFTKNLTKPISSECALKCAAAGSPLVILADDGSIYLPIDDKIPAKTQNVRLLKVAGKHAQITGTIYKHGQSKAIVIEKIIEPKI